MARCLQLARLGEYYVAPNPMVGAVLVANDGSIVGEGWHRQFGGPHAEVNCFADAQQRHPEKTDYSSCTLYVSLEPCSHYGKTPPCAKLIIEKKVGRVVVGMLDPNPQVSGRGIQILRDAGIEVEVGVMEQECRWLNRRFLMLHEHHRPYVILKWAQTADGFIDTRRTDGEPLVISNLITKQLVHKMRAENMAIMVGTRTALLDNPGLKTTRWSGKNPIRVLLDRHHVVLRDNKIFSSDAETIVYEQCTDWNYILTDLGARAIHSLIVEGGTTLLNNIISSGIYDEVHVEISPHKIGDGVAAPSLSLPLVSTLHSPLSMVSSQLLDGNQVYEFVHNKEE